MNIVNKIMLGWLLLLIIVIPFTTGGDGDNEADTVLKAKEQVSDMCNYPDTLDFHEMSTVVDGNEVTLTFTAENGFGVPETYTKRIIVND